MTYSLIQFSDGNYLVPAQYSTLESAIVGFHTKAAALHNDKPTKVACLKLVDENLDCVNGYSEFIRHEDELTEE